MVVSVRRTLVLRPQVGQHRLQNTPGLPNGTWAASRRFGHAFALKEILFSGGALDRQEVVAQRTFSFQPFVLSRLALRLWRELRRWRGPPIHWFNDCVVRPCIFQPIFYAFGFPIAKENGSGVPTHPVLSAI